MGYQLMYSKQASDSQEVPIQSMPNNGPVILHEALGLKAIRALSNTLEVPGNASAGN